MQQNWIAITGKIVIRGDVIEHVSEPQSKEIQGSPVQGPPFAIARSNLSFEQGRIRFKAWIEEPEARCQIGLSGQAESEVFAGLNMFSAAYGFGTIQNGKWESGPFAGFGNHPPTKEWIDVFLEVKGSNLNLYCNEVRVASMLRPIQRAPITFLFQGNTKVKDVKVDGEALVCFVVMQFTDEFNELYREVIRPTCEAFGYTVVRADDSYASGLIIQDITRSIRESALVIADITPNNPNVFYEVGYAHGIGKPTILLSDRQRERLPFDISGFRTLFYDNTIGGKRVVEERLEKHLASIEA